MLTCCPLLSIGQINLDPEDYIDSSPQLNYLQVMDTLFSDINREKIPSGILIDRAIAMVQREKMDGRHPQHIITRDSILELYSELHIGHLDINVWQNVFAVDSLARLWRQQNNAVSLMLIYQNYQKIKENAFDDGLLTIDGLVIHDQTSDNGTPFDTKTAFALSPLLNRINNYSVLFELPSQFIFAITPIDKLLIDFGDGMGFRQLNPDEPIPVTLPSNPAIITTKAVIGNDTLISKSKISIITQNTLKTSGAEAPADSCPLVVAGDTNWYGVWPGCETNFNKCGDCLKKVAIIVEGYDPTNSRHLHTNTTLDCSARPADRKDYNLYDLANAENMADKMREAGYDIVILNFADGKKPLEYQAEVVKALIRKLRDELTACGSNHEFVIIGPSSGGVIARYALADMEKNGEDHNTRLFVSFDAPQQGANLPLSLQHFIRFMKNTIPINLLFLLKDLKKLKEAWLATPTKQMLVYHATQTKNGKAYPAPEHSSFYTKLKSLGYPTKCRNVAIANGSGTAIGQGFNPGDGLFAINILFRLSKIISLKIITYGWAVPNNSNTIIFAGIARFCFPLVGCIITNISLVNVNNTAPYDNTPGGRGAFVGLVVDGLTYPPVLCNFCNCKITNDCSTQRENFIPTISALDLQNTSDLNYNVYANITGNDGVAFKGIDYTSSVSPFDAIYLSPVNEEHVICGTTSAITKFIENEIMPKNLYLQNQTVSEATDFEAVKIVYTGENITNRKPPGKFIVNNSTGKVRIRGGNEVVLKPGTELIPSAFGSVEVYTNPFVNCASTCKLAYNNDNNNQYQSFYNSKIKIPNTETKNILYNYPNPFTNHTHIDFYLDNPGIVKITISNLMGQEIATLENSYKSQGLHTTTLDARELPAGLYLCTITINGKFYGTLKLRLIK